MRVLIEERGWEFLGHDVPARDILQITLNMLSGTAVSQAWKWYQNDQEILGFNSSLYFLVVQILTTILGQGIIISCAYRKKFINNRQRLYYQDDLQRHLLMPIHLYFYLILLSVCMFRSRLLLFSTWYIVLFCLCTHSLCLVAVCQLGLKS